MKLNDILWFSGIVHVAYSVAIDFANAEFGKLGIDHVVELSGKHGERVDSLAVGKQKSVTFAAGGTGQFFVSLWRTKFV